MVFRSIADETSSVREGNIRWGHPVTLVVGDDLNMVVLPDADTTVQMMSAQMERPVKSDLRVAGTQIDTNGFAEHGWRWGSARAKMVERLKSVADA